ncbi:hypothetical protein JAAARDRAFT_614370 [Jaapia argillacea MUCL 33604]|uniref:Uncharacterized protein n=1 Tax=Jaapia argillacea MUCL 33604 TaxID=933084 RepID=A0A067P4J9_9AGAM|nr:hypothetical protein JAAARDRAFT_614370 [Jaapia argillacea MUCL 33604]
MVHGAPCRCEPLLPASRKYQFASELATGAASYPDSARAESATVCASPTLLPPQLPRDPRKSARSHSHPSQISAPSSFVVNGCFAANTFRLCYG